MRLPPLPHARAAALPLAALACLLPCAPAHATPADVELQAPTDPWTRAHSQLHPPPKPLPPARFLHRALHVSLGTGVLMAPLLTQANATLDGQPHGSSVTPAPGGGMGLSAQAEWWPLETPVFGTGVYGGGIAGMLPDMHGGALFGGVRVRLGPDGWLSLLGDAGLAWRTATIDVRGGDTVQKHDVSARITGSARGGVTRVGAGVRVCTSRYDRDTRFCGVPLDLLVYRDDFGAGATTFRGHLRLREAFAVGAEVSPDYPVLGEVGGGKGWLVMAHLGVGIDWLGPW